MLNGLKIVEIFCSIDDFCIDFVPNQIKFMLSQRRQRLKPCRISLSEVMTIQVMFHLSGYRNFKTFYQVMIQGHLKSYFPNSVSYNRMVELKKASLIPLAIYLKTCATGRCTGISFTYCPKKCV